MQLWSTWHAQHVSSLQVSIFFLTLTLSSTFCFLSLFHTILAYFVESNYLMAIIKRIDHKILKFPICYVWIQSDLL